MSAHAEEGRHRRPPAFSQVYIDLLYATLADVGGVRGLCIASILKDQFGARKQDDAAVPVKAIAEAAGVDADSVRRALRRLVADGVFESTGPGRFRITLDPSSWRSLDPKMAAFAAAQKADTGVRSGGHSRPDGRTQPSGNPDTGVRSAGHGCPERRTPVSAPLIEEDFRRTQNTLSQSECEPPANTSRSFPDPLPEPVQPPASTLHPKATPERRKAVVALADQAGGWGYEAGKELQLGADPDHLEEAIRRGVRSRARSWQYVARIADGFRVHGIDQPPAPLAERPQRPRPGTPEALAEWKARRDAAWGIVPDREAVA